MKTYKENKMLTVLIVILIVFFMTNLVPDDSDKSFWQRSGVVIVTDYKTGLQYLKPMFGGLTQPVVPSAKVIAEKESK